MRTTSGTGFAAQFEDQRFPPGTLVASRYRIVARLGKGGMGEVFRADDLILGQPVALKFLPESMASNVNLLTRFYDEVRIARQVTHPNVCRVYDIGEMEGQPYLSMQYIDGEDLGVLLKRIGRLPADKATEITRKLCAGLGAAHAQGVLHRDLKPANIMIDARGQVMIMDFGLAGIAEHLQGAEVRNGTPAYMAPEQLTGKEVSVRSDIYALGLVLYEMFTGKPAFEASTLAEMIKIREQSAPQGLSTYVHDMEPAVERAILKCLDPDPDKRPQSAMAVAAALPGGDPLAAALAAGETPSPEMVAAAGAVEGMNPKWALALFASVVVMLTAVFVTSPQIQTAARVPLESPPEVLRQKAREILRNSGYGQKPMDYANGTYYEGAYLDYLLNKKMARSGPAWDRVLAQRPSAIEYWYRQSPRALLSVEANGNGIVNMEDPPMNISGMAAVTLDTDGRLRSFQVAPPQKEDAGTASPPVDWTKFFSFAELDMTKFQPAEPQWTPLFAIDARAAWTGVYPGHNEIPIRIEAAAWHGKPVYFDIIGPWVKPARMQKEEETQQKRISDTIVMLLLFGILGVTGFMVRSNFRAGRGDVKGALRLGLLAFLATMARWTVRTHHVAFSDGEFGLFGEALGDALLSGFVVWGLYLALEPWVRRRWPQTLITWSRALTGRFRDPLVGRDVLLSIVFAMAYVLVIVAAEYIAIERGLGTPSDDFRASNLMGLRPVLGMYAERVGNALQGGPGFFLFLFVLRVVLRKQWLAGVAFVVLLVAQKSLASDDFLFAAVLFTIIYSFLVVILFRFGLFCFTMTIFILDATTPMFMTTDLSAWYGLSTAVGLAVVMGLAIYGFRTALGGRKLIDEGLLQS
jgi:serine/threonine-protein kinase